MESLESVGVANVEPHVVYARFDVIGVERGEKTFQEQNKTYRTVEINTRNKAENVTFL